MRKKTIRDKFKGGVFTSYWVPYAMLLPAMTAFCVFAFWPFLRSMYLSTFVTDSLGHPGTFVGLANYKRVLTSADFRNSLVATLKFAVLVGTGTFFVSMFLALISINIEKGSKVYQTMYAIPMAIASVPISAIFMYILSRYGILNELLGTEIIWLRDERTAMLSAAVVTVWSSVGASYLYLLVGFRNVSDDLVEAATLDGAGFWRKVRSVYLPVASPQIFFVMFLNIIGSFKAFAFIKQLVGRGPHDSTNVLVYATYSNAFLKNRFETACVYAMALFALIFVVTRIQLLFEKRMVHYQ